MEANENPPAPNDSLKNAAEQYKQFKENQRQHIVDMMKADEEDGLYDDLDSTLTDGLDDEEWDEEDKQWIQEQVKQIEIQEKQQRNKKQKYPKTIS